MKINVLSLENRLRTEHSEVEVDKNSSYHIAYPEFVNYFKRLPLLDHHHLVIGAHVVYGWMPTIFDFRSTNFNRALTILNQAKQGAIPQQSELKDLIGLLNNSLVGASKLLHFIHPSLFPIWDSRVYRFVFQREPYHAGISNISTYLQYRDIMEQLTTSPWYGEIHQHITEQLHYPITPIRSAEIIMFERGKRGQKSKK